MKLLVTAWVGIGFGLVPAAPAPAAPGDVTGLQILASEPLPENWVTEVVISVEGTVETRDFAMEGPNRIFVDLIGATTSFQPGAFSDAARGGVIGVRADQLGPDTVRFVFELVAPLEYAVSSDEGYVRVSIVNPDGFFEPFEAQVASAAPFVALPSATAPTQGQTQAQTQALVLQEPLAQDLADPITISFAGMDIREVLATFADFSGRSIVPSAQVSGQVYVDIQNEPWDIALNAILESQGMAARETATGIIMVDRLADLVDREVVEELQTRSYRLNFVDAADLQDALESLLTDRGAVSVTPSANAIVVSDVPRVIADAERLIAELDLQRPQINVSARIMFVDRTDLEAFGVVYDIKDSRGNQLNQVTPGAIDSDNDGLITPEEQVPLGTNVISLGGNSIAALGNANERVVNPAIQFLTSILMGRHTVISFVEALQSVNLSDVVADPQITLVDNETARILVGERTPIRVIDAAAGGGGDQGGGAFPQATVQIEETGIILDVTAHVTAGDLIRMDIHAERSGLQLLDSDLGVNFNEQSAETTMLVKDGETRTIGGMIVTERTEVVTGIPLLQDLPLLGRFFRTSREETNQRDLIILITPQIQRD